MRGLAAARESGAGCVEPFVRNNLHPPLNTAPRTLLQELATAAIEGLECKSFILNNQHLGMVMQWEDRFYKGNRAHTYLGKRVGGTTRTLRMLCSCVLMHWQNCLYKEAGAYKESGATPA